jgi:hypothetical protein
MGFDVGKDEVLQDFCNPWQEALQPPASKKSKVGYRTVRCKRLYQKALKRFLSLIGQNLSGRGAFS